MCLIVFALNDHPKYSLILGSNRDEAYSRESRTLEFWPEAPHVCAGKDLVSGGTWLGLTTRGRLAAITNVHDSTQVGALSRGLLASEFLVGESERSRELDTYARAVLAGADQYSPFNLLLADLHSSQAAVVHAGASGAGKVEVASGVHALSNAQLNTPWHKVLLAKRLLSHALHPPESISEPALASVLKPPEPLSESEPQKVGGLAGLEDEDAVVAAVMRILRNAELPPDATSPMAAIFVVGRPGYGTRACTVVLVRRDGCVRVDESSRDDHGDWTSTSRHFALQAST